MKVSETLEHRFPSSQSWWNECKGSALADKEAWRGGKQRCVNGHDGALVNKEGIDVPTKKARPTNTHQQGTMWCPEVVEIMRAVMQDDNKGWWIIPLCQQKKRMDEWTE
jgi:hypothetical protein